VAIVEGVVLEHHDVRYEERVLQMRMVHVAGPYAAQRAEAPLELWEKVGCDIDGGEGETAGEGR
jgi:hypothetical protein